MVMITASTPSLNASSRLVSMGVNPPPSGWSGSVPDGGSPAIGSVPGRLLANLRPVTATFLSAHSVRGSVITAPLSCTGWSWLGTARGGRDG